MEKVKLTNKKDQKFMLWRGLDGGGIYKSVGLFSVNQDYLDKKGLKQGDEVTYVKYALPGGREVFDVFPVE